MTTTLKKKFSQAQRDKMEFRKARAIRDVRETKQKLDEARRKRDETTQKLKNYDKTH